MWVLRARNIIFVPAATRIHDTRVCIEYAHVCVCALARARIPMGIPGNDTLYSLISGEIYIPTVVSSAHASRTAYIHRAVVVVVVPIIYFIIIIIFLFFPLFVII